MPHLNEFRAALKLEELAKVVDTCAKERTIYMLQIRGLNQKPCSVCSHDDVKSIDREILSQVPLFEVAAKWGYTKRIIQRHWSGHIRDHIRKALGTDFASQETNHLLAKAFRRRSVANFDHRNRGRSLEFVIADLLILRKAFFGDIDPTGIVFKEPDLDKLMKIDFRIIQLTQMLEKMDELKRKRTAAAAKSKGKKGKPGPKSDRLDEELIPIEQQREMERAAQLNKKEQADVKAILGARS